MFPTIKEKVIGSQLFFNSGFPGPNGEDYGGNELWVSDGTIEALKSSMIYKTRQDMDTENLKA